MQTEDYWDTLPDRISQHRQYFEGMIKLIPHNVYIPKIQDENTHWDRRFKKKMTPEEMQDRNYTRKMNKLKKVYLDLPILTPFFYAKDLKLSKGIQLVQSFT
eukprot:TRINITY_DN10362_c0_g2_i4.p1 TRINITY_DN10362_c0_g2~~TRINITY_DN10362_c0_g2_i4.p1  ORF type:complete len:102 (-),score=23.49 TRINITY_DN10362_c0_g2_i4:30-335(-)